MTRNRYISSHFLSFMNLYYPMSLLILFFTISILDLSKNIFLVHS